jgi:oligopeptide transport system substrate-binding protein
MRHSPIRRNIERSKNLYFSAKGTKWTNGIEIHAADFVYSWKKILSPDFDTPFSYHLYSIENANAAKQGKVSLDKVGVHAFDKKTLCINLIRPVPYFLELLTLPVFFPIPAMHDKKNSHWPSTQGDAFVCNGPFCLKENQNHTVYTLEKNPLYWDAHNIHLQHIFCLKTNIREALEMFKKNEIDWIGRPLRPWHSLFEEMEVPEATKITVDISSYWCVVNVISFPLSNLKLRQALSLAINRKTLKKHFPEDIPAFSPLPFHFTQLGFYGIEEGEEELACQLFEKALQELQLTRKQFPKLHCIFPEGEKREMIAKIITSQWKEILGIMVDYQAYPWSTLFRKVVQGDYELACMGWTSLVRDPLYTFDVFAKAHDPINFPKWEHKEFQELLEKAAQENYAALRSTYLLKAEAILIRGTPIIPLNL